jgi:hypothetical protein
MIRKLCNKSRFPIPQFLPGSIFAAGLGAA